MSFKTITVAVNRSTGIATVMLNRPKTRNSVSLEMYKEVVDVLRGAADASIGAKAVIITGAGEYYSSGNDQANFTRRIAHPKQLAKDAKGVMIPFVDAFVDCKVPIICAVNGPALGITVTTMALADARICTPQATFTTPFQRLGLAPEGCSSFTFPRMFGDALAKEMLEQNKLMSAEEALKAKFVSGIFPRENLITEAEKIAIKAVDKPRWFAAEPGLAETLRSVNRHEADVLEGKWVSSECLQASIKFLESRNRRFPAMLLRAVDGSRFIWDR